MAKQNFLFVIFCLVLTVGLMQSYQAFQNHFSPHKHDAQKITQLQKVVEEKSLSIVALENQLVDFQQEVAAQLPALQKIEKSPRTFQIRNLASVTQKSLEPVDLSGTILEKARAEFRRQEYKTASETFSSLIQKFPASPFVVQAHFFWAESLYLNGQHQECLDVIDQMMTQYPEHELTGFIMLRMGQILQARSRAEEAGEVYRTIGKNFAANSELRKQSDQLARSLE